MCSNKYEVGMCMMMSIEFGFRTEFCGSVIIWSIKLASNLPAFREEEMGL